LEFPLGKRYGLKNDAGPVPTGIAPELIPPPVEHPLSIESLRLLHSSVLFDPLELSEVERSLRCRFKLDEWRSLDRLEGKAALHPSTVHLCINCLEDESKIS
jgi:hypothetical protein